MMVTLHSSLYILILVSARVESGPLRIFQMSSQDSSGNGYHGITNHRFGEYKDVRKKEENERIPVIKSIEPRGILTSTIRRPGELERLQNGTKLLNLALSNSGMKEEEARRTENDARNALKYETYEDITNYTFGENEDFREEEENEDFREEENERIPVIKSYDGITNYAFGEYEDIREEENETILVINSRNRRSVPKTKRTALLKRKSDDSRISGFKPNTGPVVKTAREKKPSQDDKEIEKMDADNKKRRTLPGEHVFFLAKGEFTYQQALQRCQELGGIIAVISNAKEQALADTATLQSENEGCLQPNKASVSRCRAYIGFRKASADKPFSPVKGRSSYRNWHAGEPNNKGPDDNECAILNHSPSVGGWHVINCDFMTNVLCDMTPER